MIAKHARRETTRLAAKPRRLQENVEGVLYVNDKCINCAACSSYAPETFRRATKEDAHVVYRQPETAEQIDNARAALAACPVAAIRVETLAERRHATDDKEKVEEGWTAKEEELVHKLSLSPKSETQPFPRPFAGLKDVFWLGYHNDRSFGATPYLLTVSVEGTPVWIMVDTPRFGPSALRAVKELTGDEGPQYHFLTHVDDTADHNKWAQEFPNVKRIFHAGDLGRHNWIGDKTLEDVEILLQPAEESGKGHLTVYDLQGRVLSDGWESQSTETLPVVIVHTPGHSPGSITLYKRPGKDQPGIVFTGDTYAYTTRTETMSGFPRYGNNLRQQAETLPLLAKLDWTIVAPGHGNPRDYRDQSADLREEELQDAVAELQGSRRGAPWSA